LARTVISGNGKFTDSLNDQGAALNSTAAFLLAQASAQAIGGARRIRPGSWLHVTSELRGWLFAMSRLPL
jgi:hypothetical protein